MPRFLFGLPTETIESIYGDSKGEEDIVSRLPIVGVFTSSPNYDRIIIQTYMNIVTLSVIFLLWANNPPDSLAVSSKRDWTSDGSWSNLRESSISVISQFTNCRHCEIREWQFSLFLVILSEKLAKFNVISHEIARITIFGREQDFII